MPIREFKVQKGFHDLPTSFQPLLIHQEIFWIVSLKRLFVSDMSNTFNHGTYKDCHHRMNSICNHHVDYRLCQSRCTLGQWMELREDEIEPPEIMVFLFQKKSRFFLQGSVCSGSMSGTCEQVSTLHIAFIHPMQLPLTKRKNLPKADWSKHDCPPRPESPEKYLGSRLFITTQLFSPNSNQTNHHPQQIPTAQASRNSSPIYCITSCDGISSMV